jgi:RNA polymerase sigma factor (sigma-70 family)
VGETDNSQGALSLARRLHPDLILMEINLPDGNGLKTVQQIKQELPAVKVVILTAQDNEEDAIDALKSGIEGCICKDIQAQSLLDSLRGVVEGEAALSRRMATRVIQELARVAQMEAGHTVHQLTPREKQVLCKITEGLTNKEIADTLHISENTIKVHITHILAKLHLENRSQAAAYARHVGLEGKSG